MFGCSTSSCIQAAAAVAAVFPVPPFFSYNNVLSGMAKGHAQHRLFLFGGVSLFL